MQEFFTQRFALQEMLKKVLQESMQNIGNDQDHTGEVTFSIKKQARELCILEQFAIIKRSLEAFQRLLSDELRILCLGLAPIGPTKLSVKNCLQLGG